MQRLVTRWVGNWYSSPPLRRETAATGSSFLAAPTSMGQPDYRIQDIHGFLGCWSKLVFSHSHRGHPYKVLQGTSQHRRRGSPFLVKVVKYWHELPASVVTAPSVNIFKKSLEKVWKEMFPDLPHWLKPHHSNSLTRLPPNCTPPINSPHLYILPKSLFCLRGFFRSVGAFFLSL